MNDMKIISPKEKHATEIAKICSKGWLQTVEGKYSEQFKRNTINEWYNLKRVKQDIREGAYTHVAIHKEQVVGVIGGGKVGQGVGEVFVLYVDEAYRYKGIGTMLLDELTKMQIDEGVTEQWVSVQEGNMLGIPFYEARGFIFQKKKVTITDTGEEQIKLRYCRKINELPFYMKHISTQIDL